MLPYLAGGDRRERERGVRSEVTKGGRVWCYLTGVRGRESKQSQIIVTGESNESVEKDFNR